ncbi:hypothetical protein OC861_006647, partial [Tilletia horrida]
MTSKSTRRRNYALSMPKSGSEYDSGASRLGSSYPDLSVDPLGRPFHTTASAPKVDNHSLPCLAIVLGTGASAAAFGPPYLTGTTLTVFRTRLVLSEAVLAAVHELSIFLAALLCLARPYTLPSLSRGHHSRTDPDQELLGLSLLSRPIKVLDGMVSDTPNNTVQLDPYEYSVVLREHTATESNIEARLRHKVTANNVETNAKISFVEVQCLDTDEKTTLELDDIVFRSGNRVVAHQQCLEFDFCDDDADPAQESHIESNSGFIDTLCDGTVFVDHEENDESDWKVESLDFVPRPNGDVFLEGGETPKHLIDCRVPTTFRPLPRTLGSWSDWFTFKKAVEADVGADTNSCRSFEAVVARLGPRSKSAPKPGIESVVQVRRSVYELAAVSHVYTIIADAVNFLPVAADPSSSGGSPQMRKFTSYKKFDKEKDKEEDNADDKNGEGSSAPVTPKGNRRGKRRKRSGYPYHLTMPDRSRTNLRNRAAWISRVAEQTFFPVSNRSPSPSDPDTSEETIASTGSSDSFFPSNTDTEGDTVRSSSARSLGSEADAEYAFDF